MKKYFWSGLAMLYSLSLLSMDIPTFSLIFSPTQQPQKSKIQFPQEIEQVIEDRIGLAGISILRCVNKAAFCYYNIAKVCSLPQFRLKCDPSAYRMRSSMLTYCARHKEKDKKHKKEDKRKRTELFSAIWDIDSDIRRVDLNLLCAKKVRKRFMLKPYAPKEAMHEYKEKDYCNELKLNKKRLQLYFLITGPKVPYYKEILPNIKENFKATCFNVFDVDYFSRAQVQAWFCNIEQYKDPELVLAVIGGSIDPRAFSCVSGVYSVETMLFLLKNCFEDFFTTDANGRNLFHYMCEYLNDAFIYAFIKEARLQERTVDLQQMDYYKKTPLDILFAHSHYLEQKKKEILAFLADYSGLDIAITESESSSSSDARPFFTRRRSDSDDRDTYHSHSLVGGGARMRSHCGRGRF